MTSKNPNRILGLVVALIVLVSVLVVIVSTNRPAQDLDANSPEGVVQAYLVDIVDGNYESAMTYMEADSKCVASDLDRTYVPTNVRINLLSIELDDSRARVKFQIETPSGAPLDSYYTEEQVIRLVDENGTWKITGIPWPLYDCGILNK